ncbi:MAG: PEP/pyruvate-binding domain-containing protein [Deltaproteobacteria bacterium]
MNLTQLFRHWTLEVFAPGRLLRQKYEAFKKLLRHDKRSLELITDLEDLLQGDRLVDWAQVESLVRALRWSVRNTVSSLLSMHPAAYQDLAQRFDLLESCLLQSVTLPSGEANPPYTITLSEAARAPNLAGGKAHTLSWLLQEIAIPVPSGFVITTNAFHHLLEHNNLRHQLDELLAQVQLRDWGRLKELSQEMTALLHNAVIPPDVIQEIAQRLEDLQRQGREGPWALRSSALGEDGEASFAGQYASILKVATSEVFEAYKHVLASKYAPSAVAYRIRQGLADQETPMAVLFLEMIEAAMSGVVYTHSPGTGEPAEACVEVFASTGLGQGLVAGRTIPEVHYFTREKDPTRLDSPATASDKVNRGRLAPETALQLARWGMRLEGLTGHAQDIEWSEDKQGNLYILQSRPLTNGDHGESSGETIAASQEITNPLLLESGITASPGQGMGQVYLIREEEDLTKVPEGAVLASAILPPEFAGIIQRLKAVVAESGSRASHFAMVAREYGLPVIVGAREATKMLPPGQVVTVDADQCRIYLGEVESLKGPSRRPSPTAAATPFFTRLRKLMEFVSPLNLTNPDSPGFAPSGCRSLHDLVRFVHEKGMAEMFSLVGRHGRGLGRARQLETELPLIIFVLDLEDGISPEAGPGQKVQPQFITSEPMRACWQGLSHPDLTWDNNLLHIDWEEVDRVSGGLINFRSAAWASYAIISKDYLHLALRFGYHFAVLDTLCCADPEANYIKFRFKGGGGIYENRLLRIQLIKMILEWAGFVVHTRGDLLDARFQRREASQMLSRLTLLGLLQGKTCLLDMALTGPEQVLQMVEAFKERYQEYVSVD